MLNSSTRVLLFLLVFCAASYNLWRDWMGNRHPFTSDVSVYYSYLDAVFIRHDPGFTNHRVFGLQETPTGHAVPKMSMGLALVYLPFFMVCHAITILTGGEANGYSEIYAYGLYYSAMLFVFLGLFVLRKLLLRFYPEKVVSLTLLAIFTGTNLFYYTVSFNLMSHGFLFTGFCLMLYAAVRWFETRKAGYLLAVAFTAGLCTLIRPTTVLIILVPLLWGCYSADPLKQRIASWRKNPRLLAAWACCFLLPWVPQLIYWKIYTGNFLFYSYGSEGFDFTKPELINMLFSYRKGWLVYTPVIGFAIAGFYQLYKQRSPLFPPLVIIIPATVYILSSWWCWSWGGSFGIRALVEYYAFLAFPLAAFFQRFLFSKQARIVYTTVGLLILLNLVQTYQYTRVIIHWDRMTKQAYWFSFGKLRFTPAEREQFNALLSPEENVNGKSSE